MCIFQFCHLISLPRILIRGMKCQLIGQPRAAREKESRRGNPLEADTLRLNDLQRLNVATDIPLFPVLGPLRLDQVGEVIHALGLRRNTPSSAVGKRVALDGVRFGRTGQLVRARRVCAVRSKVCNDQV